jgi:3-oxoacyl-[acyl-carrier protein] reductase
MDAMAIERVLPGCGRFSGRVVVITGAGRGIGRELASRFAGEDAAVVVADRDAESGTTAVAELTGDGHEAMFIEVDVSDPASTMAMAQAVAARFERIDVLVNNAGITADATLSKMSYEDWRRVLAVNLDGPFLCTKAVLPWMLEAGYGRIVNAASIVGLYGNFGQSNYTAAKAGLIGMTKTWARELGPKGITVNAVAPGFIATDMSAAVPETVLEAVRRRNPLGRLGETEDVAEAYLFLASEAAAYVNGAVISVDGGMTL